MRPGPVALFEVFEGTEQDRIQKDQLRSPPVFVIARWHWLERGEERKPIDDAAVQQHSIEWILKDRYFPYLFLAQSKLNGVRDIQACGVFQAKREVLFEPVGRPKIDGFLFGRKKRHIFRSRYTYC